MKSAKFLFIPICPRYRTLITLIIICVFGHIAIAQHNAIKVESFKHNPDDLTAMNESKMDQNNQKCALIIVSNVDGGGYRFGFKNAFYEVEEKMRDGKLVYLVYVQEGTKSISITHNDPGIQSLENYYFPQPIKRASTYEMKLGHVIRTQEQGKQMLEFKVSPSNATVEVNGDYWPVRDGYASRVVPFGSYNYRVIAADCHPEAGSVMVSGSAKQTVDIVLKPDYGWLTINKVPEMNGATIYLDGLTVDNSERVQLKSGKHEIMIHTELYKPFITTVIIKDSELSKVYPVLTPDFTEVTFVAPDGVEVIVDGIAKGIGKTIVPLTTGSYIVETRKEGHRSQQRQINIQDITHPLNFVLQTPTPIYGGLEVSSSPRDASVKVDGVDRGTTPLYISNLLVGSHDVSITKSGYQSYSVRQVIKENEDSKIDAQLSYNGGRDNASVISSPKKVKTKIKKDKPVGTPKFKKNDFFFELGFGMQCYDDPYYYDESTILPTIPLIIGGHIANIDIEAYMNIADYLQFGIRSGYRFSFASRFAITPLIGWGTRPIDVWYGEEIETNSSITLGGRFEYKFSRRCGISFMGEYCIGDVVDKTNLYLSFSLTL